MRRRSRVSLAFFTFAALPALAGLLSACDDDKAASKQIVLQGRVTSADGNFLPGVTVIARCGAFEGRATGTDMGDYAISLPRTGCDRAVVQWGKESFAHNVRSLPLPTDRESIVLNVEMASLTEWICSDTTCGVEGGGLSTERGNTPGVQGWVGSLAGQEAVRAMPGEFFDTAGQPLLLLAASEDDIRDKTGTVLPPGTGSSYCVALPESSWDELQDPTPNTQAIEFVTWDFDLPSGRWKPFGSGVVSAGGTEDNGKFHSEPYAEKDLGDLRRGEPPEIKTPVGEEGMEKVPLTLGGVWLCAATSGNGIHGAGYANRSKSCVIVEVIDACGEPEADATIEVFGRDRAFYNWQPTNSAGRACLEGHRSEATGESLSANGTEGETFWLDVDVVTADETVRFEAVAMPTKDGNCGRPDTCTVVQLHRDPISGQACNADAGVSLGESGSTADAGSGSTPEGPIRIQGK